MIDNGIVRPTWDEIFMKMAEVISERSVIQTQVGSVLVLDRRVISIGYNGKPAGAFYIHREGNYQLDEIHAEGNALGWASKAGISTDGATLYSTVRPCIHCAKQILAHGLKRVVCYDRKAKNQEACPDGVELLEKYIEVQIVRKDEKDSNSSS